MTDTQNNESKQLSAPEIKKRRRGIYLLPNLFTTSCLFAGFYAIVAAMGDRFEAAAIAVFIAMVMDGLDGRVARLTNTQSDFGAQYDSLADMVSFGLAPALVMYEWSLNSLGKLGWLAAFIFAAGAALRLARFNTQIGNANKRYFQGLASPAAAALVMGMVWVGADYAQQGSEWRVVTFILTLSAGILMVSNIRYRSFKDLDVKGKVPFMTLVVLVLIFAFISIDPPQVLFGIFLLYAVSGPTRALLAMRKGWKDDASPSHIEQPLEGEFEEDLKSEARHNPDSKISGDSAQNESDKQKNAE